MPRVTHIHTHSSILVHQTQEKIRKSAYVRYSLCVEQPYCFPSVWHWDCARMLEEAAHEAAILNSSSAAATTATILNLSSAAAILPPPFWIPAVQGKRLHFAQACGSCHGRHLECRTPLSRLRPASWRRSCRSSRWEGSRWVSGRSGASGPLGRGPRQDKRFA